MQSIRGSIWRGSHVWWINLVKIFFFFFRVPKHGDILLLNPFKCSVQLRTILAVLCFNQLLTLANSIYKMCTILNKPDYGISFSHVGNKRAQELPGLVSPYSTFKSWQPVKSYAHTGSLEDYGYRLPWLQGRMALSFVFMAEQCFSGTYWNGSRIHVNNRDASFQANAWIQALAIYYSGHMFQFFVFKLNNFR